MNHSNFLKTYSLHTQKQFQQWYVISISLLCAAAMCCAFVQARQWHALHQLKQQYNQVQQKTNSFNAILARHQQLKEQQAVLSKKKSLLNRYMAHKTTATYLTQLAQASGGAENIEAITITKKSTQLSLICPCTQKTTQALTALQNLGIYDTVKLHSITPQNKNNKPTLKVCLDCTIKNTPIN